MSEDKHTTGEIIRTLERIETQVLKTNGRVTALEKWRWTITGIAIAAALMGIPNIAILAKAMAGV